MTKLPMTPEEAIKIINQGKPTIEGSGAGARGGLKFDPNAAPSFSATPATVTVNGFKMMIAADLFTATGDQEAAERAEGLLELLGDALYNRVKTAANCAGINDEAHYLSQETAYILINGTFDPTGASEPFRKDVDGQVNSESNKLIAKCLKDSNLGQIMQACRGHETKDGQIGVSNTDGLRWALLNHFANKKL